MLDYLVKIMRIRMMKRFGWPARRVGGIPLHAQGLEDMYLLRMFGRQHRGFYVDVGANDGVFVSNTCTLNRLGWKGISIEPNPGAFAQLKRRRPGDVCLDIAIGGTEGMVDLSWEGEITEGSAVRSGSSTGSTCRVRQRPLAAVLAEHGAPKNFELLSIDVEGMEEQVLKGVDWQAHSPQVVIIEYNSEGRVSNAAFDLLYGLSYRPVVINRWNMIMSRLPGEHLLKAHRRQGWFGLDRPGF